MIRFTILLALAGVALADEPKKAEGPVIALGRAAGALLDPDATPPSHYEFTVADDGAWVLKAGGKSKKGKLKAADVAKWLKEIKDGGFDKLTSNPALGAADEPYLDITIRTKGKKEQKRIPLDEKLAQAIEKKVVELLKPGK